MFDLNKFISEEVTGRAKSFFIDDLNAFSSILSEEIHGRSVLVIGGAGSIGSSFIKALLPFRPAKLVVVDLNENGLAELARDLRSSYGTYIPEEFVCYPIDFDSSVFRRFFREENGFDIVANFSAHKHVRSEKDRNSVQALLENNLLKAHRLLDLIVEFPPRHFFCVSTDKAANPVNVMGASKRIMEDLIMAYSDRFKITTARFANVAFSNGSLPAGFLERVMKRQPIAAPCDVRRYFVSPQESGQICLLASILGRNREIFFPKLGEEKMMVFSTIADRFLRRLGYEPRRFGSDEEAKRFASEMRPDCKEWPVVYFESDTTGEKDHEEFFVEGEPVDMNRFRSLGVISSCGPRAVGEADGIFAFLDTLENIFSNDSFTKEDVVEAMKRYIPNFSHEEKGRNLDQKM